jgi:hypothetical protein
MRRYYRFIGAAVFALGLLAFPARALFAAQAAIANWGLSVAPALFPFMVVLPFLTSREACHVYDKIFGRLSRFAFALPGTTASAIVTGLCAGSPAGAMAVARVARREGLSPGEAARMAGVACGVGPIYVVSGIGVALAGSALEGWRLASSQLAALFVTGLLFRGAWRGSKRLSPIPDDAEFDERPISRGVISILKVGGYMTMFAVGIALLDAVFGEWFENASLLLDLPTGAAYAASVGLPLYWLAPAVGFGGFCIAAQNMGVLRGIGVTWPMYLAQKATAAALTTGFYLAQSALSRNALPAWTSRGVAFEAASAGVFLLMLPVALALVFAAFGRRRNVS